MGENTFLTDLRLPGRFEKLESETRTAGCDMASIVQPVDDACREIEIVLREVLTSGIGRLQVFHGLSGSGKTTFLHGLRYFFKNIDVIRVEKTTALQDIPPFIQTDSLHRNEHRLYVVYDRDNPNESDETVRSFCEGLRSLFRTANGKVLVVWPITDERQALRISGIAWNVGRDSLLGTRSRVFEFAGLSRDHFQNVADITTRALNTGESLDSFGIGPDVAQKLARESSTIGEYYSRLNAFSAERNAGTLRLLKARVRPRVWIVVPGDDLKELDRTVSNLTQGTRNRLDIDKIAEFLDNRENESAYLNDWRARRNDMAYLMRILDVRLFEMPANAALAAVRSHGEASAKANLQKKSETPDNCADVFERIRLGQAIIDPAAVLTLRVRDTSEEMAREFMSIQQLAGKGDAALNKAVGAALKDLLSRKGLKIDVRSEKQNLDGSQLCPDIQVPLSRDVTICLELTWRSTGKYIEQAGGDRKPQNTLTTGHIMKYLLEKVMDYVKDLKL